MINFQKHLEWFLKLLKMMKKAIPIATAAMSSPQQIAFNAVGRQAIFSDPNWNNDDYLYSFSLATWATQTWSYYGARTIGIFNSAVKLHYCCRHHAHNEHSC